MFVNYELLWKQLKDDIIQDLKALADPGTELDSSVAFRIAGEKTVLNTMNKLEREL